MKSLWMIGYNEAAMREKIEAKIAQIQADAASLPEIMRPTGEYLAKVKADFLKDAPLLVAEARKKAAKALAESLLAAVLKVLGTALAVYLGLRWAGY